MAGEIIDTIQILGIKNAEYNFLYPVYISINSDVVIQKLTKYKIIDIDLFYKVFYLVRTLKIKQM